MDFLLADKNKINGLVKIRIAYIRDEQGFIDNDTELIMKNKLPSYFEKHLGNDLFAFVAVNDNVIVASAFLLIVEKPSNPHFINGLVGTVLNVYTAPEYRRQGIAEKLMEHLVSFAKKRELDYLELNSTNEGYPLYKKMGFFEHDSPYTNMRMDIHA